MFSFRPIVETEEELQIMNLMEAGIYDFVVLNAESRISKSGNPMLEIMLKVWDLTGKEHIIYDYLLDLDSMRFKIKHFCEAVGLDAHLKGSLQDHECKGKGGKVKIVIQKPTDKYPAKNAVYDYIKSSEIKIGKENTASINDDLPF